MIQGDVAKVIQMTIDGLADEIAKGDNVELLNFGTFEVVVRRSKVGRNPNAPTKAVIIPERVGVKFRSGKELKERVEKLTGRETT